MQTLACWLKLRRMAGAAWLLFSYEHFRGAVDVHRLELLGYTLAMYDILKICMNTAPLCTGLGIYCLYKILLIASMTSLVRQINTSGCKDVVRKINVTINVYKIFACSSFSVHT